MSKHRHQNKNHQASGEGASISVGTESPNQQEQTDAGVVPSYEEVQKRAYQIHEQKGGSDFENWLEAERVFREEHRYVEN